MIPLLAYWYYFFPPWRPWNFLLSLPTYCYDIYQPWQTLNAMQIYDPTAGLLILFFSTMKAMKFFALSAHLLLPHFPAMTDIKCYANLWSHCWPIDIIFFLPWRPWNFFLSPPTYCYHISQPWRTLNAMQIYEPSADLLILFFFCHEGHDTFWTLCPPIVTKFSAVEK